jgi:hypothetical protein
MATYAVTIAAIFVMLLAWIIVQQVVRLYALRHPEFGPPREDGSCGSGGCGHCGGDSCETHRD